MKHMQEGDKGKVGQRQSTLHYVCSRNKSTDQFAKVTLGMWFHLWASSCSILRTPPWSSYLSWGEMIFASPWGCKFLGNNWF